MIGSDDLERARNILNAYDMPGAVYISEMNSAVFHNLASQRGLSIHNVRAVQIGISPDGKHKLARMLAFEDEGFAPVFEVPQTHEISFRIRKGKLSRELKNLGIIPLN